MNEVSLIATESSGEYMRHNSERYMSFSHLVIQLVRSEQIAIDSDEREIATKRVPNTTISNRKSISMSAIDSSLDGITVEFGDEFSESDEERDRSGFGDQSRGGDRSDSKTSCEAVVHSVTSPATVNTRLDCGPNACPTGCAPKKWVLGVRHLSLASDSLNERMAERGKHFSHSTHSIYSSNARDPKRAPKRETVASNKPNVKPMEAIGEEPLQSHESSRRHQNHPTAGNIIYKKNGFNVMKERVEFGRQNDDRQVVTEVNPDSSAPKATKSESKSVPQLNAKYKGRDGLNGDHRSVKLNQNVSVSCKPIPKIDYNTDDNECDYGKRTKNCDKKLKDSNDCDKHKKISDINIHSIGLEAKENKKLR